MAFTTYRYKRGHDSDRTSMNDHDIEIWERYVPRDTTHVVTRLSQAPSLLGFSNYPWNKVVRTSVYRERGLEFGGGAVHNDILGHWQTLLRADDIVLVDRPMCMHVVDSAGANLTNQMSRRRLELFDALDEAYELLRRSPTLQNRYAHHYWKFALRTIDWAGRRIHPDIRPEFNRRLYEHLLRVDIADLARIRLNHDPELADRMVAAALA